MKASIRRSLVALAGLMAAAWLAAPAVDVLPAVRAGMPPDARAVSPAAEAAQRPKLQLPPATRRTVVWINIDGVRGDYLDRGTFPTLARLEKEGAFSRNLVPVFPSLTFPSHTSHATGAHPAVHGIPSNIFYDRETRKQYSYPADGRLLAAEPIWLTAARQGIRTAVYDWPLSHAQAGEVRADYFAERFDSRLRDQQRLAQLLDAWKNDGSRTQPLQLLMGYMEGTDGAGHRYGPDSPQIADKLKQVDRDLGEFLTQALDLWQRTRKPGDEFYLLVTTDHGMSRVDHVVNLEQLTGLGGAAGVQMVRSGNVAHLFFDDPQIATRQPERLRAIAEGIGRHNFAKAYLQSELPEHWQMNYPSRTGDIVIVLAKGYGFASRGGKLLESAAEAGGLLGMHGYDPKTNPEMDGMMILWRAEQPLGGINLGRVDSLQLHPTVAALLGIDPSRQAKAQPLVQVP